MASEGFTGVFDSGVGGLKVLAAARKLLPGEDFTYVFDRSHSPYGTRGAAYVRRRAIKITDMLVRMGAKAVVAACNTATAVAIDDLRARHPDVPIVGVEPPVAPAIAATREGESALILCTPLTASSDRLKRLVMDCPFSERAIVAPMPGLASLIEEKFAALGEIAGEIDGMLSAYDGRNVTAVALGCTHYYYVAATIAAHFGRAKAFDGAAVAAGRLRDELVSRNLFGGRGRVKYLYL